MLKSIHIALAFLLIFALNACQQKEEVVVEEVKKVEEKPLPPISSERVELWLKVTGELSGFVRKFSLDDEEIRDKRDLMILAHSSSRTQFAYGEIFKNSGMTTKEYWLILDKMQDVRKYNSIKKEEAVQNKKLDELIASGTQELARLSKQFESMKEGAEKDKLQKTIAGVKSQLNEFKELKGNLSAEDLGITREVASLWESYNSRIDDALFALWKINKHGAAAPR